MTLISKSTYHKISWAGIVITVVGSIFFSTKAVIVKYAFNNTLVDAVSLLALRMLFSLPFYLGAAWIAGTRKGSKKLSGRDWMAIVGLGLIGYYLSSLLDFLGLQYVSAGLERLILFLYPTFTVLINVVLFRERISRFQGLALGLTYAGIVLAYVGEVVKISHEPAFYLGSLLILLCAITYASYIVGSGRMIPRVGITKFTAYCMLASTVGVFIHFLFAGNYTILHSSSQFIWYGILLAVVATVIPSFLISAGMKRVGANNVAIISSVGPVSTILQAHFILGEPIYAAQVVGTILIVTGVILVGWKSGV